MMWRLNMPKKGLNLVEMMLTILLCRSLLPHFKFKMCLNGVTNPSAPCSFHLIQVMKVTFSHVSLYWREIGKADCTAESYRGDNKGKKHPRGTF